jgi:YfiH family protein
MSALVAGNLDAPGLRHGFFTREGGVSDGLYRSLNCGFGSSDRHDCVAENRDRVLAMLDAGSGRLTTVHQKHTNTVVTLDAAWAEDARPVADAMVTTRPGLALGILTADCAPVLLADVGAGVIAAAHAGWRGAFTGVIENTVAAMIAAGARRESIRSAIGPCIAQASYQVGPEFVAAFTAQDPAHAAFFSPADADGRPHFDLLAFVEDRLRRIGIAAVETVAPDTCVDEERFFSFRRATLRREGDYGRQISVIALAGS